MKFGKKEEDAEKKPVELPVVKPTLPTVNLLPENLVNAARLKTMQQRFFAGIFAIIALAGLVFVAQTARSELTQQSLTNMEEQKTSLQATAKELAPVQMLLQGYNEREALAKQISENRVNYTQTYNLLVKAKPGSAQYVDIELSNNPHDLDDGEKNLEFAKNCGQVLDPFAKTSPPIISCIKIAGIANTSLTVDQLAINLSKVPQFSNVYVTQAQSGAAASQSGQSGVTFQGTLTLKPDEKE